MDNNIRKKFTKDANREDLAGIEIFKSKEDGKLYYLDSNRQKVEVNTGGAFVPTADPNVPIKTYCAEILNLGPGTTPQVNAVLINTFDGTIAPEANLPSPLGDGVTKILSLDNEFTVDKTMVTITLLETTARVNDFVKGLGTNFVNINFEQSANGIFTPVNNVKILVKIEVYA